MKIGIFKHGGQTRNILSIEIGRAAKRDIKPASGDEALVLIREWLIGSGVPLSQPEHTLERTNMPKYKHNQTGELVDAFRWNLDSTPEWWRMLSTLAQLDAVLLPPNGIIPPGVYVVCGVTEQVFTVPKEEFEANYQPDDPVELRDPQNAQSYRQKFWGEWADKRVVIQTKGNRPCIIKGTFRSFENKFLRIEDVEIIGIKNLARVRTLMVDRDHIGHFHEPGEVEKIEASTAPVEPAAL